jgi:AcrR family transcriptional regulator
MQSVQNNLSSNAEGLRERKRGETHARIQSEGIRLFLEHGFEETTLDDIAGAASVSRRTLFHYFASKEEIVFSTRAGFPLLISEAVSRRPVDEPLLDMIENALDDMAALYRSARACEVAKLIQGTPALSAADWARYGELERILTLALATRKGLADTDLACRVTAATAAGIIKLSTEAWLNSEDQSPRRYGKAAFAALRSIAGDSADRVEAPLMRSKCAPRLATAKGQRKKPPIPPSLPLRRASF